MNDINSSQYTMSGINSSQYTMSGVNSSLLTMASTCGFRQARNPILLQWWKNEDFTIPSWPLCVRVRGLKGIEQDNTAVTHLAPTPS